MAVYKAGFPERVFEFSFNAEYAFANQAVLAGVPELPSQNEERWLGYDVALQINAAGGAVNTLALQHKVARLVDYASAGNWHFQNAAGLPYFAFRVDVDQFNVIQSLAAAGMPGIEFYYCAPLFATRANMDKHYMGKSVMAASIWIDVASAGPLDASQPHSIVYAQSGASAFVFSDEFRPLKVHKPRRERSAEDHRRRLGRDDFRKLYDATFNTLLEHVLKRQAEGKAPGREPLAMPTELPAYEESTSEEEDFLRLRNLVCRYLGVSLLVEVAQPLATASS